MLYSYCAILFFFFQAEDGIRDIGVTGVQTCALPISEVADMGPRVHGYNFLHKSSGGDIIGLQLPDRFPPRSEERRVGKECRSRWSPDHEKKKDKKRGVEVEHDETEERCTDTIYRG